MSILKCEEVCKVYGSGENRVVALQNVNLSVECGEFVAIVGASGSGKSTLLHIIGRVDSPTSGRVFVEDIDTSHFGAREAAIFRRRKVGLIYQFYNLIPTLSVEKNILLPILLDKRKPDPAYFRQIVDVLGLSDKLGALPSHLSGGQQQRTAIARALVHRPAILLADEPTGNLDQRNTREIVELLKYSNQNFKQTVLLITHDERVAVEANRIITIEDGKIISERRSV